LIHALGLKRIRDQRGTALRSVARYRFRHALFQQYLTTRLDPVQRTRLHEATGRALETLYTGGRDAIAAQLAYHFEAAGLIEPAIDYLLRAGQRAYRLSAPAESTALYQRALTLLRKLPESEHRDRREMEILLHLEEALMTARGWGAPERAELSERAYQLGQQLGETERLLPVLRALVSVHIARAEHRAALNTAERLLALAEETANDLYVGIGERMLGTGHFFLGHYTQARQHLALGLRVYRALTPDQPSKRALVDEEEIRLRVWLSNVLLVMGYPDQATTVSQEALMQAEVLGYLGVQGIALTTAGAVFHAACRQAQATLHYTKELLELSTKHLVPSYRGWASFYQGWALACQGQPSEGLAKMHTGLEQLESTGTQGSMAHLFTLMAEVYAETEEIEEGWIAVDRALNLAEETGARSYLAEMHRVQGVLHLKEQAIEEAGASFERAIDVAQEQAARLWELRATADLTRLREAQGRATEGHARLRKVYAWFTEGLDIPDLVEARALLGSSKTLG
jgi:tetratricopeptide (TPR) repeat protein